MFDQREKLNQLLCEVCPSNLSIIKATGNDGPDETYEYDLGSGATLLEEETTLHEMGFTDWSQTVELVRQINECKVIEGWTISPITDFCHYSDYRTLINCMEKAV